MKAAVLASLRALDAVLGSAWLWFTICGVLGSALIVWGVYLLTGEGGAALAAGVLLLLVARVIGRGLNAAA